MKKITAFLLLATLIFTNLLYSCEKTGDGATDAPDTEPADSVTPPPDTAVSASDGENNEKINAEDAMRAEILDKILDTDKKLSFNADGKFKVLIFSDTHGDMTAAPKAIAAIAANEKPDLVLFDGDNTFPQNEDELRAWIDKNCAYMEENGIAWAQVYGNHDAENSISKERQQAVYEAYPNNLSSDKFDLYGVGNYVLPIYGNDGEIKFNVWGIDSNMYLDDFRPGFNADVMLDKQMNVDYSYDYIHPDQIMWYYNASSAFEDYCGGKVPGFMFFHIPLLESNMIWMNPGKTGMVGERREGVFSSEINSGLFAAVVERGDVNGMFNGHDHVNDYVGEYLGVRIGYVSTVSQTSYNDAACMGCRVINISEDDPANWETHMIYLTDEAYRDIDKRTDVETMTTETLPDTRSVGSLLTFENGSFTLTAGGNLSAKGNNIGTYFASGFNCSSVPKTVLPVLSVADGAGYAGGSGLSVVKPEEKANSEFSLYLPQEFTYNGETYLRVWVDFTGIDFRKACFGLIGADGTIYRTDELDGASDYIDIFTLAEGETKWQASSHGGDGCFGAAQASSMQDFKGWMAVRVSDMPAWDGPDGLHSANKGKAPAAGDKLTGIYFYFDLNNEDMLNKPFILDEFGLCDEYWLF